MAPACRCRSPPTRQRQSRGRTLSRVSPAPPFATHSSPPAWMQSGHRPPLHRPPRLPRRRRRSWRWPAAAISTAPEAGARRPIMARSGIPRSPRAGSRIARATGRMSHPGVGPGSTMPPGDSHPSTMAAGSRSADAGAGRRVRSPLPDLLSMRPRSLHSLASALAWHWGRRSPPAPSAGCRWGRGNPSARGIMRRTIISGR
jgi:hypothetical protein